LILVLEISALILSWGRKIKLLSSYEINVDLITVLQIAEGSQMVWGEETKYNFVWVVIGISQLGMVNWCDKFRGMILWTCFTALF